MSISPENGNAGKQWALIRWAENFFYKVEIIYLLALPVLGGLAIYHTSFDYFGFTVMAGWLLAMMHVYLHLPFFLERKNMRGMKALLPLAPVAAAGINQGIGTADFWHFFLENTVMEAGALMLGLVGMFLFGKGISGKRSFEDLGYGLVVIVIALFLASAAPFFLAWAAHWPKYTENPLMLAPAFMGLGFATYGKFKMVKVMSEGGPNPDVAMDGKEMYIIALIFGWLFLLPLIGWLTGLLDKAMG